MMSCAVETRPTYSTVKKLLAPPDTRGVDVKRMDGVALVHMLYPKISMNE